MALLVLVRIVITTIVLPNSVGEHFGILLGVILIPGFALVLLAFQAGHNTDLNLVVIVNGLFYSGLLYLFFLVKEKLKKTDIERAGTKSGLGNV